jgi:16S rRNA (guanine966-N2)-methyltransferase
VKIVAGRFGGRNLKVPKGRDIRPTSSKIRGAVFNMLRSRGAVEGAVVLDAFCGTGALGLEAISQGARFCVFVDKDKNSLNLTRENATSLNVLEQSKFLLKDSSKLPERPADIEAAGLVFLDPPYGKWLLPLSMEALYRGGWIFSGAWVVCETEKSFAQALPDFCTIESTKIYGDTQIMLCRVL